MVSIGARKVDGGALGVNLSLLARVHFPGDPDASKTERVELIGERSLGRHQCSKVIRMLRMERIKQIVPLV